MSLLMYRAYGVMRGDVVIIRWIAVDGAATETAVVLVFGAVMVATMRHGVRAPIQWIVRCALMATIGLAVYASIAWLIGKAHAGTGSYLACLRTAGYAIAPVALGGMSADGMAVGFAVAFIASTGVLRAVHKMTWSLSALTAVVPLVVVMAAVASVVARA